jgi:hypothetical protein
MMNIEGLHTLERNLRIGKKLRFEALFKKMSKIMGEEEEMGKDRPRA